MDQIDNWSLPAIIAQGHQKMQLPVTISTCTTNYKRNKIEIPDRPSKQSILQQSKPRINQKKRTRVPLDYLWPSEPTFHRNACISSHIATTRFDRKKDEPRNRELGFKENLRKTMEGRRIHENRMEKIPFGDSHETAVRIAPRIRPRKQCKPLKSIAISIAIQGELRLRKGSAGFLSL